MKPPDGSDLMVRFVQGDDDAFEPIVKMYEHGILNFFFRLTGERHAAEDMTQEMFLKVFRYRDTYKPQSSFKYFLFRMARNLWIDRYRKAKVRPRSVPLKPHLQIQDKGRPDHGPSLKSGDPSPLDLLERKEGAERLAEAVTRLPDKQRDVLALCLEGGLRYVEIAEILEVPVGTVKSRMHSAVLRLKELMGDG